MSEALDNIIRVLQEEAEKKAYAQLADERREWEAGKQAAIREATQARQTADQAQKARIEMRNTLLQMAVQLEEFAEQLRAGLK